MSYKEKVKEFFAKAKDNGYDRAKIRRRIEHQLRELANTDEAKFDDAAYAIVKSLDIKLKKRRNNECL